MLEVLSAFTVVLAFVTLVLMSVAFTLFIIVLVTKIVEFIQSGPYEDVEKPAFFPYGYGFRNRRPPYRGHAGPKETPEQPTDAQVPAVKPRPPINDEGATESWKA